MNKQEIISLIDRYTTGELSQEELMQYFTWFNEASYEEITVMYADSEYGKNGLSPFDSDKQLKELLEKIQAQDAISAAPVRRLRFYFSVAAAAVLLFIVGGIYFLGDREKKTVSIAEMSYRDIVPGKNGALLTLADGSQIFLDSISDGQIANQSGAQLTLQGNKLVYHSGQANAVGYNTMTTPRGRQFELVLSDGTKVWLNAGSSIKYPTKFTGFERKVEITGEVYFEVSPYMAGAEKAAFVVASPHQQVRVLGTHFNINAYEDEERTRTTLMEGRVEVSALTSSSSVGAGVILAPDQQSTVVHQTASLPDSHEKAIQVEQINGEQSIAWKNGYFDFEDENLSAVLRLLSRWYDVSFEAEKLSVLNLKFSAVFKRDSPIDVILSTLSATGAVKFRNEGGVIKVY